MWSHGFVYEAFQIICHWCHPYLVSFMMSVSSNEASLSTKLSLN